MILVRQFADGRVALRVDGLGGPIDGEPVRWFTVDVTKGGAHAQVEAMTDRQVSGAIPLVPYSVEPTRHDGAAGSTDWTPALVPYWYGPFGVGDFVLVSTGVVGVDGGLIGEIMELHPGGLWLDSGGPDGRTWFPASAVGTMAYAEPPRG